jgi:uncharacterized protein YutE (UPF0331/DUF86 family)
MLLERLHTLEAYIKLLEPYQDWDIHRLTEDEITYGGVLHYLQLSAQIVLDVSAHLNAELNFGRAANYREAVLSLGKHEVLPLQFAEQISNLSGFRNVLVHEYLIVDPIKVQKALQDGLNDLKAFIVYITNFLKKEGYTHNG